MIEKILLVLLLPAVVLAQSSITCHRCFGNGFCNNASDADFQNSIRNATCNNATWILQSIKDDPLNQIELAIYENLRAQFSPANDDNVEYQCLTATVIEPHDTHTLRTCIRKQVNSNSTCDVIKNIISPQNKYNGSFSCQTCTGNHCNTHTLRAASGVAHMEAAMSHGALIGIVVIAINYFKL